MQQRASRTVVLRAGDTAPVTGQTEIARELDRNGYAVLPGRLSGHALAAARAELGSLLEAAGWGSGFDGSKTKRVWAPLARTRCLDQAALDPLVLAAVEDAIGPGAQFGNTSAIQVHPGQNAQVLHYEQGIYPLPRDRDVMLTALWALDDFTAANGATRIVPGSHRRPAGKPDPGEAIAAEMPAGGAPRLQELLGSPRYLGFVNGKHPRDWLMEP